MFFSRAVMVVHKTTGGKKWNPPGGLRPLSKCQRRNRKASVEQALKNHSVLRMAAAHEPPAPTRLYKNLNHWRLIWMRKKLDQAKHVLGWGPSSIAARARLEAGKPRTPSSALVPGSLVPRSAAAALVTRHGGGHAAGGLMGSYAARVRALALQLNAQPAQLSTIAYTPRQ